MVFGSYQETDKMYDVIASQPSLLQMMCRFGISLGVGERTIREVCEEAGVDTPTFLAVANYMRQGRGVTSFFVDKVSVVALVKYLKQAHAYFLDFQLPNLRRKLIEAIDCSRQNEVAYMILKFYDEFMAEVRRHMTHEDSNIFSYVESLVAGRRPHGVVMAQYKKNHDGMDHKLQELKNIIIKYYRPSDTSALLSNVLKSIFDLETDLRMHCEVEDVLFVPAVELLERQVNEMPQDVDEEVPDVLSERERDVLRCVVRGQTNKEIANTLFISINTVLTHRKNIARKLGIHSVSGLTIYAIANEIIKLEDLQTEVIK